jgi:Xaa-Pro aminopeptidase
LEFDLPKRSLLRYPFKRKDSVIMKGPDYTRRLELLREGMSHSGHDTLWVMQPENRRYVSGFRAGDAQLTESSGSLLINADNAILITDSRYTTEARKEAGDFNVFMSKSDLADDLAGLLSRIGTKVLGFDENHLTWGLHKQITAKIRQHKMAVRLKPAKGIVERLREIKDKSEADAMKKSADIMSEIMDEVFRTLKKGKTEKQVAREIELLAGEAGADGLSFPSIVASGPNGALPHAVPTDRRIGLKEPVVFDVGLRLNGYCCDMTRTIFLDKPGPEFRKIYKTVREAQLAALEHVRPGVMSTEPDSIARDIIRDAGFGEYFGHSLGHGVGLAVHEAPRLAPKNPVELKKGMVVTVEPGIYIPGKGGVRLEEMVFIDDDGPRILTGIDHYYEF